MVRIGSEIGDRYDGQFRRSGLPDEHAEGAMPDQNFRDALEWLREITGSGRTRPLFEVLMRCAIASPAAAAVLSEAELRTRQQRRAAVLAVAGAITAERDRRAA